MLQSQGRLERIVAGARAHQRHQATVSGPRPRRLYQPIAIGHRGSRPARPPATNYSIRGYRDDGSTTDRPMSDGSSVQTTALGSAGFSDPERANFQRTAVSHKRACVNCAIIILKVNDIIVKT